MKVSEIQIGMKVNIPTVKLNGKDRIETSVIIKRNTNPFLYVTGFENSVYGKRGVILHYTPDDRNGDFFYASDLTPYDEIGVLSARPAVGSQVMIRPDLQEKEYINGIYAVRSMMEYRGKIATVKYHSGGYRGGVHLDIDNGAWNWSFDMLTNVTEIEHYECIKAFPGAKVGDILLPTSHPVEYFIPEYFKPVYKVTNPIPKIEFEGYTIGISEDYKTVNWGCKEFTKDELKQVIDFVSFFNERDLGIGLKYVRNKFTEINIDQLKHLYKILK